MTSRPRDTHRCTYPTKHREQILGAAAQLALSEGLEALTLPRVADELGVFPGLVSRYFSSADELVTGAFKYAATREALVVYSAVDQETDPFDRMRLYLRLMLGLERDGITLLWIDAWHACRTRANIRPHVKEQFDVEREHLAELIREGVTTGAFETASPRMAATRILAALDGLAAQVAAGTSADRELVRQMVIATAEGEVGVSSGTLAL